MSADPDSERLRALRAGDRAAFDWLFHAYSERVWRYVARLVGGRPQDVADVVQETFLHVARSIGQFDPQRGSLWGWMCGIAQNRVRVHWRSRLRQTRLLERAPLATAAGAAAAWLSDDPAPDELLAAEETASLVREVLAGLPDDYTVCLMAKYVDQLSASDIAGDLGESTEAVRSRLSRAREAFRSEFRRRAGSE